MQFSYIILVSIIKIMLHSDFENEINDFNYFTITPKHALNFLYLYLYDHGNFDDLISRTEMVMMTWSCICLYRILLILYFSKWDLYYIVFQW